MSELSIAVDPANIDQARAWDGDEGAYWADNAERFDRFIATHHAPFLAAAAITATDRVLDIGCGTGQATRDAARAAKAGSALGVDLSTRMLDCARQAARREGTGNAAFEQGDAQIYSFPAGAFDVAISRTGAMFFGDPVAAFANIACALRPGGRLCLLTWQPPASNEWIREIAGALAAGRDLPLPPPDAPGPFALSDPGRIHALLSAAGYTGVHVDPGTGGAWVGHDADDACRFVLGLMGWMLQGLDDHGRMQALGALGTTLAAHDTGGGVIYQSATWTIRAIRP
jgi:SAM-dependent methyltransferase